ncbi:MAG: 23S rRNA (guanosine(2251)-2'-O)-methyltransferase RlmB [Campylobacterota bacterium]|nr:23S rRNA (guanosine(2251)-2'-O)-methyltransferase RlmB [Campylobacterota bacterium]
MEDSQEYKKKKAFFASLITLYGRNSVIEVLEDEDVSIHKLHLCKSNREEGVIAKMIQLATHRGVQIAYHDKNGLSRISKNAKQDQGVAIDIVAKNYNDANDLLSDSASSSRFLALDSIHNPQNLGMIIRSAAAGNIDGIILPKKNSAKLSPLVMKASAGTLFKIPIYYCDTLEAILPKLQEYKIYQLSSHASNNIYSNNLGDKTIFVLGNESEGVSQSVARHCPNTLTIPMQRGVESLNVAITAALIAFMP